MDNGHSIQILCCHFERLERVLSMEFKYSDQFMSSFCMSARNGLHFYPEYTRSQQDLQFVEANKLLFMPHWRCELANCPLAPRVCYELLLALNTPLSVITLATQMAAYRIAGNFRQEKSSPKRVPMYCVKNSPDLISPYEQAVKF